MILRYFSLFILAFLYLQSPQAWSTPSTCEDIFLAESDQAIRAHQKVFEHISSHLDEKKVDQIIGSFIDLYDRTIAEKIDEVMTEKQFYDLFMGLKALAEAHQIRIERKIDTIGVFPDGLEVIRIAGFSQPEYSQSSQPVGFIRRHELGHLFHVIALRSILVAHSTELSHVSIQQLNEFVARLEGGRNYLEFEKIVTDISGGLHSFFPNESKNLRYGEKLRILLLGLKPALFSGKVRFKNGWGILEIYAKLISKAPLILGNSLRSLALRLPLILFIESYLVNPAFREWVNQILQTIVKVPDQRKSAIAQSSPSGKEPPSRIFAWAPALTGRPLIQRTNENHAISYQAAI